MLGPMFGGNSPNSPPKGVVNEKSRLLRLALGIQALRRFGVLRASVVFRGSPRPPREHGCSRLPRSPREHAVPVFLAEQTHLERGQAKPPLPPKPQNPKAPK